MVRSKGHIRTIPANLFTPKLSGDAGADHMLISQNRDHYSVLVSALF